MVLLVKKSIFFSTNTQIGLGLLRRTLFKWLPRVTDIPIKANTIKLL